MINLFQVLGTTATVDMSSILSTIATIFAAFLGMVSDVVDTITSNPLLFFIAVASFAGVAITLFKRLLNAAKGV